MWIVYLSVTSQDINIYGTYARIQCAFAIVSTNYKCNFFKYGNSDL